MRELIKSDLSWYSYRVWVWEGTTVKPYEGDVLATDDDAARITLTEDVYAEEHVAESILIYKGTFDEYEAHQRAKSRKKHGFELE